MVHADFIQLSMFCVLTYTAGCFFLVFAEYKLWEEEIEKWQNPILKDERLPEWYILSLIPRVIVAARQIQ